MHQGRMRRLGAAVTVVVAATLAGAGPAGAASAVGCTGTASSVDSAGSPIDEVSAPGGGGTKSDPFTIDPDGPVSWNGKSDAVITDGTWKLTSGIVPLSGSFDNDDQKQTSEGSKKLTDYVPAFLLIPGLYKVDMSVTGEGGTCTASGYIEIDTDPMASAWTYAALLFLLLAILLLMMGRPDAAERFADMAARPTAPGGPPPMDLDGGAP